jgi:hypothetical protein
MVRLSDVVDVCFKQDVNEVPVRAELTGNPAVGGVVIRHGDLQLSAGWHCNAHSMGITLASHMGCFI